MRNLNEKSDSDFENPLISKLVKLENGIHYEVIEYKGHERKPDFASFGNSIHTKDRDIVKKYFPFSDGAPDWLVALLKDYNNLVDMKELIGHFNTGGEDVKGKNIHTKTVSNIVFQDVLLSRMLLSEIDKTKGDLGITVRIDKDNKEEKLELDGNMAVHDLKRLLLVNTNNRPFFFVGS